MTKWTKAFKGDEPKDVKPEPTIINPICGVCQHLNHDPRYDTNVCRRYPPTYSNGFTGFPKIAVTDSCGEWKAK